MTIVVLDVTSGAGGSRYHRNHRYQGTTPVVLRRFFA
jgi:hypothetical protein